MCYTDVVPGKKKKKKSPLFCCEWFNNSVCRYISRFSVLILPHVAAEDVYESQIWAQSTYAPCRQFITVAQLDSADRRIDSRKARKTITRSKRDRYTTQLYMPHTLTHFEHFSSRDRLTRPGPPRLHFVVRRATKTAEKYLQRRNLLSREEKTSR